jgi:predicted pyridoxine 5'-phosphate oxidase superfamily flavin-nucleotide-binding protein
MELKDIKNRMAVLSSVGKDNKPHSIAVEINEANAKEIIITDNYMQNTIKNLKINSLVSLTILDGTDCLCIDGKAKYFDSGKWIDFIKGLKENKGYPAKGAIVIKVLNIKKV